MSKPVFVYMIYIASTPEKVFKALTDTDATAKFWFGNAVTSDWKVGSRVELQAGDFLLGEGDVLEVFEITQVEQAEAAVTPNCRSLKLPACSCTLLPVTLRLRLRLMLRSTGCLPRATSCRSICRCATRHITCSQPSEIGRAHV